MLLYQNDEDEAAHRVPAYHLSQELAEMVRTCNPQQKFTSIAYNLFNEMKGSRGEFIYEIFIYRAGKTEEDIRALSDEAFPQLISYQDGAHPFLRSIAY